MFTVVMSLTHVVLIGTNQTTLEHVAARAMNDQENDVLDEMHSFWACKYVPFFLSFLLLARIRYRY
jgi:hypothetical protein